MNRIRVPSRLATGIRKKASFKRDSESLGILSRVSQLNEILGNELTSYTEKSKQCYEYYRNGHINHTTQSAGEDMTASDGSHQKPRWNLIQDVSRYREINTDVIKRICYIFTKTSSMRAFLLQEVLENIRRHDFASVISAYELMEECFLLSERESAQVSLLYNRVNQLRIEQQNRAAKAENKGDTGEHTEHTPDHKSHPSNTADAQQDSTNTILHIACNLLLSICIHSGESLLAVALADECQKINPTFRHNIKPAILDGILISLSIYDPLMHHYKSYAIFKMLRIFGGDTVPLATYFKMISNMSVDAKNPFFANMLYDHVMRDARAQHLGRLKHDLLELYLPILKNLIAINLHHGNVYRAANLWLSLQDTRNIHRQFLERNSVLLEAILHEFLSLDVYQREPTVTKLLQDVDYETHPHLLDFALKFYGEKPCTQFENLVKLLKPPLGRSTLSALFSALLAQNKEKAGERIMQTIFRTQRGLNSSDFEVIVKKLLSQNKVSECIDMFRDTSFLVASKGSMHILAYLLRRKRQVNEGRKDDKGEAKNLRSTSESRNSSHSSESKNLQNSSEPKNSQISEPKKSSDSSESKNSSENQFLKLYDEFVTAFIFKMLQSTESWQHFTVSLIRFISRNINNRVSRRIYEVRAFEYPKDGAGSLNLDLLGLPSQLEQFVAIDMTNRVTCLMIILKQAHLEKDRSVITWCADELNHLGVPVSDIEKHFMNA